MRVIGRVHEGLIADDAQSFRDRQFFALDTEKNSSFIDVPAHIVDDLFAFLKLEKAAARIMLHVAFPGAGEALQTSEQPGRAGFHKTDAQAGKLVEDTIEDDAGKTDHLSHRMAEGVDRCIRAKVVHQQPLVRATVNGDRTTETFGLAVNGPILVGAQVWHVRAGRRQHRAAKTEIPHDAPELDDSLRRLLKRDQAHRFEARALRYISVVHPVVVGARQLDRPVAADDLAEGESGAGVEHAGADADVVEKKLPAFAPNVGESAFRGEVAIGIVQMIDGGKWAPPARLRKALADVLLGHVFPNRRDDFHDVAIAVDDLM